MATKFLHGEHSHERLWGSALSILHDTTLCSMATSEAHGDPHASTAFFCVDSDVNVYFLSEPTTKHCINIKHNSNISVTVYNTLQVWGSNLRGLQLWGACRLCSLVEERVASSLYAQRFSSYAEWLQNLTQSERAAIPSRFYIFCPERITILDEPEFGEENFVTLKVVRSGG